MKICFVVYGNLYLAPYIQNYLDVYSNEDCDIICWNRHGVEETREGCNVLSFNSDMSDNKASKVKKLLGYFKYTKFVRKNLKQKDYDLVILLQSIAGVFNARTLLKKYKNKYVMDVRDYSIEGIPIIKNREFKLLRHSRLNVISSEGYKNFLPKDCEYLLVHNYSKVDETFRTQMANKVYQAPFVLSYIGLIRFQEQNKKIISLFANDNRFKVRFVGKNALELKPFIEENGITNVDLIDAFPPQQTLDFYAQTDAILNVYGNHTPLLDYALSNKLYFSAALSMPILVSKDTFMETISVNNGFGFVLDFEDPDIKDKLFTFMSQCDRQVFKANCDAFIEKVQKDNAHFASVLEKQLEG